MASLLKKHGAWHLRYYDLDGKQRSEKLVDVSDHYRTKRDVNPLVEAKLKQLRPFGNNSAGAGTMDAGKFAEDVYLPWAKSQKRAATYNGYAQIWNAHLKTHLTGKPLHSYRPYDASSFLDRLASKKYGRNTVAHVRSLLSGIFRLAVHRGLITINPIRDAGLSIAPKAPKPTPHYSIAEMRSILTALVDLPQAQVALILAFVGLRTSEIAALRWEDIGTDIISVRRSAWRGTVAPCKNQKSIRQITMGPTVRVLLENYRQSTPITLSGYVLENSLGNILNLGSYSRRVIRPELEKHGLEWKGYYAGRRGSETEMNRFTGGNSQITSHHYGHSKEVADAHYIKPIPEATRAAALQLDGALGVKQGTNKGQRRLAIPASV